MELDVLKLLAGAGDLSTVALVIVLWKFDRRLTKLEWGIEAWQKRQG